MGDEIESARLCVAFPAAAIAEPDPFDAPAPRSTTGEIKDAALCAVFPADVFAALEPANAPAIPLAAATARLPENPNIDAAAETASRITDFSGEGDDGFDAVSMGAESGGAAGGGCTEVAGGFAITGE